MTTHQDFFADFAVSGEVCGAGLGTEPGAWVAALGPQFVDNDLIDGTLIRYFGFVTATFRRAGERWVCETIDIKPGELRNKPGEPPSAEGLVPEVIRAQYGEFPPRIPFEDVADRLVAAGAEIHHVRRVHEASLELYWVPGGQVLFWLISPYQADQLPGLRIGDVYSVSTSTGTDIPRNDLTRFR